MKKGFTLVELLGVITILGLIAVIVFPNISKSIKNSKENLYREQVDLIEKSATRWGTDHLDELNKYLATKIPLSALITGGYLSDKTVKDPRDDSEMNGCVIAGFDEGYEQYTYKYYEQSCNDIALETSDNCFTTKDYEEFEYTINTEICETYYQNEYKWTQEETQEYCDVTTPIEKESLKKKIDFDRADITTLENNNVITVTKREITGVNITDYNKDCPPNVVIPEMIDGRYVKKISYLTSEPLISLNLEYAKKLQIIGSCAFCYNGLSEVKFGALDDLRLIGSAAFRYNNLTSIDLSGLNNLWMIGEEGFRDNEIEQVLFPTNSSLEFIDITAFAYNQINDLQIPNTVKVIDIGAFEHNEIKTLTIPSSVLYLGENAFIDNQLPDDKAFIYERNNDGSIDNTKLNSYGGAKKDNIILPANIIDILSYSFWNSGIKSITLSNNIKSIGHQAFDGNNLTNIIIPSSVTTVGESAFARNQLTSITISDGVTTIKGNAFSQNQLVNVIIPSSVTTLGGYAFSDNELTSAIIKGKSSSVDFAAYGDSFGSPFKGSWATGYSDANITWNG